MKKFWFLFYYELISSDIQSGNILNIVIFYVSLLALFPLGIGNALHIISTINTSILVIMIVFTVILQLEGFFDKERASGNLKQYPFLTAQYNFKWILLIRAFYKAARLLFGLILAIPIGCILLNVDFSYYLPIILVLIPVVPSMLFLGLIGSSLLVGFTQKSTFLMLLLFPLFVPLLIFTISYLTNAATTYFELLILYSIFIVLSMIFPYICNTTLKSLT
jgi:heme exporter protein B